MSRRVGDVTFYCGKAGGVHVTDEHDVAGEEHADRMNHEHRRRTGQWATLDQRVEWMLEGEAASRARMTITEHKQVVAAIEILERHGYKVKQPTRTAD